MPRFRRLSERDLHGRDVPALIAHIRAARAAGDAEQEHLAQQMIAFKEHDRIVQRVRARCRTAPDWTIEEIAGRAFESSLRQQWRGETPSSFGAWMSTIIRGEIASFFRTEKGRRVREQTSLDAERGDERSLHDLVAGGAEGEDLLEGLGRTLQLEAAEAELAELEARNAEHARIVHLALWGDRPSREVAEECGVSVANVDQIKHRFRTGVRRRVQSEGWEEW